MTYLLGTNACIQHLNDRKSAAACRIARTPPSEIALCSPVKSELYHGAFRSSRRVDNLSLLGEFFPKFRTFSFDDKVAEICGRIRADLGSQGTPIGPNDLMIAAIAIANDLVLVTHNISEFSRVTDLAFEDWKPTGASGQTTSCPQT
ncbi:MAG: hypothetical protein AUJ92_03725 [Armatimonadetes bacterium CG2_30_59_28]|nr:type II toxin-antitoxin system VapC family toxin [Armatimonadota bacterium]OIO97434.1 MAG: hypothetical protein AUJ92_03725 [Armatimonadetes bacterium CG2_30_59_28]PIU66835.1 MAG: VapC toxin family PIN domain ribonuclease [Armatimonadetes bacterium CG07_land_8_20_14_0_80_59_28]PIX44846.1 MAG: VapC toxin family PIN domain ribonuclease [Armatimonadetes bacterium CG_4_8_14_3_um_filter_58_9]PIY39283.1 MAG: VapC toxin family PIN domain ribonuclease [Armatimonadetes bacterium CG_4_10_14_3_um_filte